MVKLKIERLTEESDANYRLFTKDRNISVPFNYGCLYDDGQRLAIFINGHNNGTFSIEVIEEDEDMIDEIIYD